jgi:hypothetical protein
MMNLVVMQHLMKELEQDTQRMIQRRRLAALAQSKQPSLVARLKARMTKLLERARPAQTAPVMQAGTADCK